MSVIQYMIADHVGVRENLASQAAYHKAGNRIYPAGATETEAVEATVAWIGTLETWCEREDAIIASLRKVAATYA